VENANGGKENGDSVAVAAVSKEREELAKKLAEFEGVVAKNGSLQTERDDLKKRVNDLTNQINDLRNVRLYSTCRIYLINIFYRR
jgi:predicted  nucleic acid-binding Zn-ribbon protein